MRALGISGLAGSGKTTAALHIEGRWGFRRKHIATPLRAMLAVLLRANGLDEETIHRYLEGDLKETVIPELGVTSRQAQITLGTEWGRQLISPDLWARTWARGIGLTDRVMNDSVRFLNEEEVIREMGGITIMIERPGAEPAAYRWNGLGRTLYGTTGLMWGVHDSERTDRLMPDYTIVNDGSVEDLHRALDEVMMDAMGDGEWLRGLRLEASRAITPVVP